MTLSAGVRLGPYEIVAPIGAGGMGQVYKARDLRLERTVAVKVLPPALAVSQEFRDRFEREARAVSSLNHPHICVLHDVGHHDGLDYFVMEYCEGDSLEARLERGPLKLAEALRIAIQIADALGKAHRAGIVHRDLKPGNVILTRSGAKLLDFGLAKSATLTSPIDGSAMPTAANLTARGTILGTIQYMSPEQLEGREADARSDIFALGAVLYEMLTGRKAFQGTSHASLIAAILEHDPAPMASTAGIPAALDHVVGKCLSKAPDDRWQHAHDLMTELTWIASGSGTGAAAAPAAPLPARRRLPLGWITAAAGAGLLVGGLGVLLVTGARPPQTGGQVSRVTVPTAPAERLQAVPPDWLINEGRPSRTSLAWSPDGRSIVFSGVQGGRQQLYLRPLDELGAVPIGGTDNGTSPFFSPDGKWLGFWAGAALKKIPFGSTGPATTICAAPQFYGASWGADDTIVFAAGREGLWRVPSSGGTPQRLSAPDPKRGEIKYLLPQLLPDGQAVLFTVTHTLLPRWDDTDIAVLSLATGDRATVVTGAADGRYAPSGHLVYLKAGVLMAAPFDARARRTTGGAVGVVDDVLQAANMTNEVYDSGAGQFAISATGSLLYVAGGVFPDPERVMVWVDRSGRAEPLPAPPRPYLAPRLSPDGRRLAVSTNGSNRSVWLYDLARGSLNRIVPEARNLRGIWTRDGQRIAFASSVIGDENIYWKGVDGGGTPDRLSTCECLQVPALWSGDSRTLVFIQSSGGIDILGLSLDDRTVRPIVKTQFDEMYPDLSPDGRWLAYTSNESGRLEVYVQPFPGPGPRVQISTAGGTAPAWSPNGRELFYITSRAVGGQSDSGEMMVVPIGPGATVNPGVPRVLFQGRFGAAALIRGYDITADGQRFVMVQARDRPPLVAAQMVLVDNWIDELRRRVPVH